MARHGKVTFDVAWPKGIALDGEGSTTSMIDLLASDRIFLAFAGSSKAGWAIYAVNENDREKKQQVSPLFCKDFGDTRADMIKACARAYGDGNTPVVNLGGEHPAEAFYWRTVG